jgi:hypothetical protein
MQSLQPDSQRTPLNGVTAVTILTAPAAGFTRTAVALRLPNGDTAPVTAILYKDIGGSAIEIARREGLAVNETWDDAVTLLKRLVLKPTESLKMALSGAPATNQPVALVDFLVGTD